MNIACLIDDGYEDSEYEKPRAAFTEAGHTVTTIGLERGKQIKGKKGESTTTTEKAVSEVQPDQFDALFLPGGYSPDHLRADDGAVEFVAAFARSDRPLVAICHGPQLLISADAVKGRRMTAWKTIQVDLRHAGADVVDEEVVVDGNLVTSRQPGDIPAFNRESMKLFERVPAQR